MVKISRKLGIGVSPFDILKGIVKQPCRTDQQLCEQFLEKQKLEHVRTPSDLTKMEEIACQHVMPGTHLYRGYVLRTLCNVDTFGTPFSEIPASHQKANFNILGEF